MQSPEWEENDSLDFIEAGGPRSVAATASKPARSKVRILELRRQLEERRDSKRIEMEYGSAYLDDESVQ